MANVSSTGTPGVDWLGPETEDNDLQRYLSTLRHRGWLIVATVAAALLVAGVYVKTATPVYEAQSSLLFSPVPASATLPTNIPGLISTSSDPTRDIQTAADVVSSLTVAKDVKSSLRLSASATAILGRINVQPVANSNVLAITAKASTPTVAAALANGFARTTILDRTVQFRAAVGQQIAGLNAQLRSTGGSTATGSTASLAQQLAELRTLRAGPLPDMSISALAVPPPGRTSPRVTLTAAASIVAGLVLGILGILGLEAFDSILRREDQLKTLFRLPILARVPRDVQSGSRLRRRATTPRTPESLAFPTLESFRTLRAMALASRSPDQPIPRSLLVTSAAPGEGKTTTALNLAASVAASGASVILIEGDLRRPSIGKALGLQSPYDVTSVVTGEVGLARALVSSSRHPNIKFLLADGMRSQGSLGGDALFLPTVGQMLKEAERLADFVVVDSPPLLAVIDALELAREADCVLIVAQLGRTHLRRLAALGSLLKEAHIAPAGIALIGAELPGGRGAYAYQYQQPARSELRPALEFSASPADEDPEPQKRERPRLRERTRSSTVRD
jgi:polysaccharide biosynthesis transport protein